MYPSEQYEKEKLTIDIVKANVKALYVLAFSILLFGLPYFLIWREQFTLDSLKGFIEKVGWGTPFLITIQVFIALMVGIVLHELIHGLSWVGFTKNGWKSIKFGVLIKMLTPYCHCKEPLKVKHYIFGAIMPAVILGIIPAAVALFTGNLALLLFGIFFITAAGGDFMVVDLLRKENMNSYAEDHPSEAGCFIYREKTNRIDPV